MIVFLPVGHHGVNVYTSHFDILILVWFNEETDLRLRYRNRLIASLPVCVWSRCASLIA